MALDSTRFGRHRTITAHLWSQVGEVARSHEPTPDQAAQRTSLARIYADFVAAARASLMVTVYDMRLSGEAAHLVFGALNERARSGVAVRLAWQPGPGGRAPDALAWLDPGISHQPIGAPDLLAAPIRGEPIGTGHPLLHSKYLVRDAGTAQAAVLTGSANLTNDAWSIQDNNIVVFEGAPDLARYFANDFAELWDSGQIATTGRLDTGTVMVDGVEVGVAFAPGCGRQIDADVAGHIAASRLRVLVASMVMSSGSILGALIDRCHALGEFGGIFDASQMRHILREWTRPGDRPPSAAGRGKAALFAALAPQLHAKHSLSYHADTPHNFMHNKLAVCDDIVVTGSFNFSVSATRNAENVVMVRDRDFADGYAAYVRRLTRLYPATGVSDDR